MNAGNAEPPRPVVLPPRVWSIVAELWLSMTPRDTFVSWQALAASEDPTVQALRQRLHALSTARVNSPQRIRGLLWGTLDPQALVRAFEAAALAERCTRAEVNRWQEAVLTRLSKRGTWR
ncbi:MAG: hypothetical protein AB7R40_25265 [Nitrospiraceae bacterium]